ncbi:hypothetical protein DYB36_000699 [Aphanomyces astaci]|uniref:Uncharacterized protein n=1 Tax=Aphanomyces astaci TaxID=112090 RepID=A0A397AWG4_APHAT|nr:hypothetical protein DYB36_000699 [Aphanomyces astaci]
MCPCALCRRQANPCSKARSPERSAAGDRDSKPSVAAGKRSHRHITLIGAKTWDDKTTIVTFGTTGAADKTAIVTFGRMKAAVKTTIVTFGTTAAADKTTIVTFETTAAATAHVKLMEVGGVFLWHKMAAAAPERHELLVVDGGVFLLRMEAPVDGMSLLRMKAAEKSLLRMQVAEKSLLRMQAAEMSLPQLRRCRWKLLSIKLHLHVR